MSGCGMTKSELERLLKESGFGSNEAMFSCYFTKQGGPPLCAQCHQMIGAHSDGAGAGAARQY